MADGILFVGWGPVIIGREVKAGEVFMEAVKFFGGLQQKGDITHMEVVGLAPHGGDLNGFFLLKGDRDKLAHLRLRDDFERVINRAIAVVQHIGVVDGLSGEDLGRFIQTQQEQTADITG